MLQNIYSWAFVAGLFLAAALVPLTCKIRSGKPAEISRRRSIRFVKLNLGLSCFVAVVTAAGFVVGFEHLLDTSVVAFLGVVAVAFGIMLRIPRAVGVPVLVLLLAATLLVASLTSDWYLVRGAERVATLRIVGADDTGHRVEWLEVSPGLISSRAGPGAHGVEHLEGEGVAVSLEAVRVPAQAFFLGAEALVRVTGLTGIERTGGSWRPVGSTREYEPDRGVSGIVARVQTMVSEGALPGFEGRRQEANIHRPIILADYGLYIEPEATVEFRRDR